MLTLARAILVFDEISFLDHPTLSFLRAQTVGHHSEIRHVSEMLQKEGYKIQVLKPNDQSVGGELEKLIDVDLGNHEFRKVFFRLIQADPSFLVYKALHGNLEDRNKVKAAETAILNVQPQEVPHTISEIKNADYSKGMPPNILIALVMAMDSHQYNLSSQIAIEQNRQLFGDNLGMELLLKAKFNKHSLAMTNVNGISHMIAFKLMESLIKNEAFHGKKITDIARFRNKMAKERERFTEHVLSMTVGLNDLDYVQQSITIDEILYKDLLPEAREYQNKLADNWGNFFKSSSSAVIADSKDLVQIFMTILPVSFPQAFLVAAASLGKSIAPSLIKFWNDKESIDRRNPYVYLMKFH